MRLWIFLVALLCTAGHAAPTEDTGTVNSVFAKKEGWWVELTTGMPNAIADRTCRLELFFTDSDRVADLVLYAAQNALPVTVRSIRCQSSRAAGDDAYHLIDSVRVDP